MEQRTENEALIRELQDAEAAAGEGSGGAGDAAAAEEGGGVRDLAALDMELQEPDPEELYEGLENTSLPAGNMMERARFIPIRLVYEERRFLRLVEAAVRVSDYTTAVDVPDAGRAKRRHTQLQQICALLSGLISSEDYDEGRRIVDDRNYSAREEFIQDVLEVARRYKIMNPEKMRTEYGKLVYFMQDAGLEEVGSLIGISVRRPIKTVYELLEERGGLGLLSDPIVELASREILPDKTKSRAMIDKEIKSKNKAIEALSRKYSTRQLSPDDIRSCLYSICDNNSFLNSNRLPIDKTIELLKAYFRPDVVEGPYTLAIAQGEAGARLTHNHEMQYNYVLQSLTLWREIVQDLFRLWYLAEEDLLDGAQPYELANTGQGVQRVQQSPRVYRAMHEILYHTERAHGDWVGSRVIHLGDRNVPNALVFIDKYTQVSRILGPLVNTIELLGKINDEDPGVKRYLEAYGGLEKARKDILHDFFTHGFDGSGADNFVDAGSCVDGRLTSAWAWCAALANKPYYPLFRLAGFTSFNGEYED